MCDTCGCNEENGYSIVRPVSEKTEHAPGHDHTHAGHDHTHEGHGHTHAGHDHTHEGNDPHHSHAHVPQHEDVVKRRITVETDILQRNNMLAERNRGFFEARDIAVLNLVSSPGSGKTTLLEKTIQFFRDRQIYVIEGDQQTTLDAQRIDKTGVPVLQVNTGNGCHLDAEMIHKAVRELNPEEHSLLLIENVGNLVCPALFDLGENHRIVIVSVTEGDDKPLKYPNMFQSAQVCIINKTDLMPYVECNLGKMKEYASMVNPELQFIELSAKTGEGFDGWIQWIKDYL